MRVVASIAALVVAAAITACGGDGDRSGASAASSPKRDIQTEAQQRAESMLLELSDFPDGWTASPPDPSNREEDEKFWKCIGSDFSAFTITGEGESKAFAHGDTTEASSDSTVFESEDQAQSALAQLSKGMNSAAVEGCVHDMLEKMISEDESAEGIELGDVGVAELNVAAPAEVAETRAWQLVVEVAVTSGEGKGLSADAYLDYVQMRQGDCVAGWRQRTC